MAARSRSPRPLTRKARPATKPRPAKAAGRAVPASKARVSAKAKPVRAARPAAEAPSLVEAALATFAHEVRTPLTGILAVCDLLATSDLDVRERRWAETIKASADHLSALATLFVDAARSGRAGLDLRQDFFDLGALARIAGDSLAGRAAARGLRATVRLPDTLPGFVIGDPVRLRAALENLIDNAVKFTEQGSVELKLGVRRLRRETISVMFAVSDSGIGLSLGEIKRLFRPFSQANVGIAARFGGAGLGLASARQIARAMGGDITVQSRRGGGTTFTLTVTLARDPAGRTADIAAGAEVARRPALRILSVEDNPFGRVVLNTILTELGHHTEFVGDGEAAIARVSDRRFDAVLMDMVLPGIGGVETIRRIRASEKNADHVAIIGVSGRGDDEGAARRAGADAFLLKPVSPRALATVLGETVRAPLAAT
ncbi:ATP-binding protein [Bradyrhizobium sp. 2TAF24]|uniref:ATP-binding protein n=1 Tax=Bradyrhizobium sp. 2TAF24 TaxID=3233011 RepID=UPI003F91F111